MLMIFWTIAIMMRSEEVPKKAVSSSHCSLDDVWIGPKEKMTWAVMPDEKKGFTFNLLRSCWGFAAPQIEAITDQRPASGWHISWGAAGSNHQNQRFSHSQHSGGLSVYPKATGMVTALNQDVITRHWNPKKVNGCVAPFERERIDWNPWVLQPPTRPSHQGPNLSSSERCQICSTCHRASAWSFAEIWGNV